MATLILNTGFEHGVVSSAKSTSLVSPQSGLFDSTAGTAPTASTTTPHTGTYALRTSATAASVATWNTNTFTTGRTSAVLRVYFRVAVATTSAIYDVVRVRCTNSQWMFGYEQSTGNLKVYEGATGTVLKATGPAISTATWYRLDLQVTNIGTTVSSLAWMLDGALQGGLTGETVASGGWFTQVNLGDPNVNTRTLDYDDLAVSGTSGDYPIGPGYSQVIVPSTLTLHSAGVFVQNGTATAIGTGDWALLDEVPISETATFIRQTTGSSNLTTGHPTLGFANSNTDAINGVRAYVAYSAANSNPNEQRYWVRANSVDTYLHGSSSTQPAVADANRVYASNQIDNGGATWTDGMIDGLVFRWGSGAGTDIAPIPRLDNVTLEVDFIETVNQTPTPPVIVTSSAVGVPAITSPATQAATAVATVSTIGTPTVDTGAAGDATHTTTVVATSSTVGVPSLLTGATPTPPAVVTSSAVDVPTLSTGSTHTALAVVTTSSVGVPVTQVGATITAIVVATVSAVGVAAISASSTVTTVAVATASAIGVPSTLTVVTHTSTAVATLSAVGVPTISAGSSITATAVSTTSAVGVPEVQTEFSATAIAVATVAAVGSPSLSTSSRVAPPMVLTRVSLSPPAVTVVDAGNGVAVVGGRVVILNSDLEVFTDPGTPIDPLAIPDGPYMEARLPRVVVLT